MVSLIKAVIFDMFETLITHYRCPLYFGAQMAADAGIPEVRFQTLWRATETDRSVGNIHFEEVIEMILKENQCYDKVVFNKMIEKRISTKEACFLNLHSEIIPMLEALKEKEIRIGLISNCFSEEAEVIRRSSLFPYFDKICLSFEEKIQKPDEEIYRRCMDRLEVKPKECIYIGDGGSQELETARKLGMKTFQAMWYLNEREPDLNRKKEFEQMEAPLDVLKYIV